MREINGADAGSLHRLRFKLTHNDSMEFPFSEITMPITETSTAGYVAMRREVINLPRAYEIPPGRPYRFNTKFDQESGYRTRSMLTLPMKNSKGEVLGLLVHSSTETFNPMGCSLGCQNI